MSHRLPIAALALALALAFAAAQSAWATSVIRLSLAEMRDRADVVVDARVVGQRVVEERGRPVTYSELLVVDAVKGARAGDVVTVFQPGVLDGTRVRWVVGAHAFHVGDEVVFYARRYERGGAHLIVALTAGYGVFTLDHGAFVEDAGGAVDAGGAALPARTFATFGDVVGAP
jgi:hypothetical protein